MQVSVKGNFKHGLPIVFLLRRTRMLIEVEVIKMTAATIRIPGNLKTAMSAMSSVPNFYSKIGSFCSARIVFKTFLE